ncbi:MAG: energy-coupled thiamine transporter ThiT [Clostridia bacterium]
MTKTKQLTECAILIAIAFVLSSIKIYTLPNGGSVTLCSMLPLIIISHRNGLKWGILSGFIYSVLQIFQGFWPPPNPTFINYCLSFGFDYIIAFTVLGTSVLFEKPFKNKKIGFVASIIIVSMLRALSHTIVGVIIWESLWGASIIYNFGFMIPESILIAIVGFYAYNPLEKINLSQTK